MAEGESTPQNLYEFTNNLLDDLGSGAITPEEALVALEQYGYLRDILTQSTNTLARSLTNTEAFSNELRSIVDRARGLLSQSLPQLRRTLPDGALPPAEIASRAQSFAKAREDIRETLANRQNHLTSTRRAFITALVANWIEQSRGRISAEQAQAGAGLIESTLGAALASNTSLDAALGQVRHALEKSLPFAPATLEAAYRGVASTRQTLIQETDAMRRIATVPSIILRHPEIRRTDWFTGILLEQFSTSTSPVSQVEEVSTKLVKTAEVISSPPPTAETLQKSGGIFTSFAQTGMQKALAGVADGVFLFLGPTTRDRVLQIVLSKTAQRVLSDTDSLTKRLGEAFVDSPVFAEIKQKLQETIASPRDGISPLLKTKSLVGDLFTTVVGSPVGERLVGSPREAIYTYLETLRLNAVFSPERRFWPSALPFSPTWQYLYIVSLYSSPGAYYQPGAHLPDPTSAGVSGAGGFGGFLLGATAGLGRVLGAPLSWLGGGPSSGLLGFFNRGVESLFGSTFLSRWLGDARRRAAVPTRITEDMPLMVALVVVISIIILFVLPTFFNFSFISQVSKTSALLCSEFTGGAYCGGRGPGVGQYPPGNYFDIGSLTNLGPFNCFAPTSTGITSGDGTSAPLTTTQADKIRRVTAANPSLALYSCVLGCGANPINVSAYPFPNANREVFGSVYSEDYPGNIVWWSNAFGASDDALAENMAHEMAHILEQRKPEIFDAYAYGTTTTPKAYCGPLGTYPAGLRETIDETFAESARFYLTNNGILKALCPQSVAFFDSLFLQCR